MKYRQIDWPSMHHRRQYIPASPGDHWQVNEAESQVENHQLAEKHQETARQQERASHPSAKTCRRVEGSKRWESSFEMSATGATGKDRVTTSAKE